MDIHKWPSMAGGVNEQQHYDVVIVGVGAHGSAALYQLAKQGLQVIYGIQMCIRMIVYILVGVSAVNWQSRCRL